MSQLPRPTSAASTSSSSGIGTLPMASRIPKPGLKRETSFSSVVNEKTDASGDTFKVGDRVSKKVLEEFRILDQDFEKKSLHRRISFHLNFFRVLAY